MSEQAQEQVIDLFEGMNTREVSQQGSYFSPGVYTVEIVKCLTRDTQKSGRVFLVETVVVASSDLQKHPIGAKRTWIQGMKNKDIGQRAVLGFLFAACQKDVKNDEDLKFCNEKIKPNSPRLMSEACKQNKLAGKRVNLDVTEKRNQTDTQTYNLHTWSPGPKAAA